MTTFRRGRPRVITIFDKSVNRYISNGVLEIKDEFMSVRVRREIDRPGPQSNMERGEESLPAETTRVAIFGSSFVLHGKSGSWHVRSLRLPPLLSASVRIRSRNCLARFISPDSLAASSVPYSCKSLTPSLRFSLARHPLPQDWFL